ncbi:MAG: hypothetical protein ACOYLP_01950 [Flavobacterium sp.]|uniref:hypothetical protein n=1 Tax=Flavobacterium sp. TaxID=239 RepID=UPI003BDAD7B9
MQNKILLEELIRVNNSNHICSEIIKNYRIEQDIKIDDFAFAHLVYSINDKPVLFHINFSNTTEDSTKNEFNIHLQNLNQKSFSELLYLVTYYGFFKEDEANLSLFKDNNSTGAVASYLESTNGKLLYHYQVEQLYSSISNSTIDEAITFRKAINLKRPSAFEKAKTMLLPSGESLFEVITKYRFRDFTLYPKIKEAIALYNYLNQ